MTRRIVQIAALLNPAVDGVLFALTDDSAVFVLLDDYGQSWSRLPDIPQDEPADPLAEIEKFGARIVHFGGSTLHWVVEEGWKGQERIGNDPPISDIRAAAARLLERIKERA